MTYEVEFTLLDENDQPVGKGLPGYGIVKLIPVEPFLITLTDALERPGYHCQPASSGVFSRSV